MNSHKKRMSENKDIIEFLAPLREPVPTPQSEERLNDLLALAKDLGPKATLLGTFLALIRKLLKQNLLLKILIISFILSNIITGIVFFQLVLENTPTIKRYLGITPVEELSLIISTFEPTPTSFQPDATTAEYLLFALPNETLEPTPTAVPPTPTAVPPTPTAVPPTPTAVPPTPTAVPPTPTAVPPTPTDIPPSPTAVPPTPTAVPPTPTAVPPTPTAVPPTPTDIPPSPTAVPPTPTDVPPTPTDVPNLITINITSPVSGETITGVGNTRFSAVAYDDVYGSNDGDGIASVSFSLSGPGGIVHSEMDSAAPFCEFGGDGPCSTMGNPMWATLVDGNYTLTVTAESLSGNSLTTQVAFMISVP